MKKKIRIKGVEGLLHWFWVEQIKGRFDGKNGQIIQEKNGDSSPWIKRKEARFLNWKKKVIAQALLETSQCDFESRKLLHAIKKLTTATPTSRDLEVARQSEIRLSELEAILHKSHAELLNALEEGKMILSAHLQAYWKGVRFSIDTLPISPTELVDDCGLDDYLKYYETRYLIKHTSEKENHQYV